jgi:SAM-dependent methyltransferase
MASGWSPAELSPKENADGIAYHRALYHDGDLNRPAGWHEDSVHHLLDLASPHIQNGSIVVDYGTGTGGSAIELLKRLDAAGITIQLILIDPLVSWFSQAREILAHRDDVHFELSIEQDAAGRTQFRRLEDMLDGRKADVIISSSTLHLVPTRALEDLCEQFSANLAPEGILVWDSGDIESELRPDDVACLHDPYRGVREQLRNDEARQAMLSEFHTEDAARAERRLDHIFPVPFSMDVILSALEGAGFSSQITDHVVDFDAEDAERFILVPRLAEIAAPLIEGEQRDEAIRDALAQVLAEMETAGTATSQGYRSHWVYGRHSLSG